MAKLALEVEDSSLKEAELILDSIGLDMEIAVNIFIKKIVKEKGLPFSMKQPAIPSEEPTLTISPEKAPEGGAVRKRKNQKITESMILEVWNVFKKLRVGVDGIREQGEKIAAKTGMNPGSACIHLNILLCMSKGKISKRDMTPTDFEFYLDKFKNEMDHEKFQNAKNTIKRSLNYWRTHNPSFTDKMEKLLARY